MQDGKYPKIIITRSVVSNPKCNTRPMMWGHLASGIWHLAAAAHGHMLAHLRGGQMDGDRTSMDGSAMPSARGPRDKAKPHGPRQARHRTPSHRRRPRHADKGHGHRRCRAHLKQRGPCERMVRGLRQATYLLRAAIRYSSSAALTRCHGQLFAGRRPVVVAPLPLRQASAQCQARPTSALSASNTPPAPSSRAMRLGA